jgi:polysaccharide pyruvyl transferase WcaK-like protein
MSTGRLMLIADAGGLGEDDRWHVGDEAMLAATIAWLRAASPGTELVAASSSPDWTRKVHGVGAVPCLDFGDDADHREARASCAAVLAGDADRGLPFAAALAGADAVLFCGAGNLCSAFPNRLYERVAVAGLARVLGKPYAFSAQTIGPLWDDTDRKAVVRALAGAAFVGARDGPSAVLAARLGVAATRMADDALALTDPAPGAPTAGSAPIGVTLHRSPMAERCYDVRVVARLLDRLAESAGAGIVFIPHFRGPRGRWDDTAAADELASRLGVPMTVVPWSSPADTVRGTAACRFVLSTRYHPLVFALGSGVPAAGLYQDDYHSAKMGGAMELSERRSRLYPADLGERDVDALAAGLTAMTCDGSADERERQRNSRARAADQAARSLLLTRLVGS